MPGQTARGMSAGPLPARDNERSIYSPSGPLPGILDQHRPRLLRAHAGRRRQCGYPLAPAATMRAGLPLTVAPTGTSRVTTLPAPITALSAIVTPGRIIAPPPIHTSRPIRIGRPNSTPV